MCGIGGFSLAPKEAGQDAGGVLADELLRGISQRGGHATGAAWWEADTVWYQKQPVGVEEFLYRYDSVPNGATSALLHTRYATKGDTQIEANNHPIVVGDIVGIHNGVVWNDLELHAEFGCWDREATVDSEAVFGALAYGEVSPLEVLEKVDGTAALAWFDSEPGRINLARVSTSPLVVGRTVGGSIVFASTKDAVRGAVRKSGLSLQAVFELDEGRAVSYQDGRMVSLDSFDPWQVGQALTEIERMALNLA